MTSLLVSVRDGQEARDALEGGADIIDVKEPLNGSLGAATLEQLQDVLAVVNARTVTSAAMGELAAWASDGRDSRETCPVGFELAKIGLAGCGQWEDWQDRLLSMLQAQAPTASPVAVVYADWKTAGSPSPDATLEWASYSRCPWILVDTFDKRSGSLLDLWALEFVRDWVIEVHKRGLKSALAGSLRRADFDALLSLNPDVLAVRGAACQGERVDRVCAARVQELKLALASSRRQISRG